MSEIKIRDAIASDVDFCFEMAMEASGNILTKFIGCGDFALAEKTFKRIFSGSLNRFHMSNTKIAEIDGIPLGFIISYDTNYKKATRTGILQLIRILKSRIVLYYLSHPVTMIKILSFKEYDKNEHYISTLATHKEARGKGVGKALLNYAVEIASSQGLGTCSLIVEQQNSIAQNLYKSCGFTATTTIKWPKQYYRMKKVLNSDPTS